MVGSCGVYGGSTVPDTYDCGQETAVVGSCGVYGGSTVPDMIVAFSLHNSSTDSRLEYCA